LRQCPVAPIAAGLAGVDDGRMVQLVIRCHPRVPVSGDDLERWLEGPVKELRADAPRGIVRLSRLIQGRDADLDVGWLIELELDEGEPLLETDRLAEALRDIRLLGLDPTLLAPRATRTNGRAARLRLGMASRCRPGGRRMSGFSASPAFAPTVERRPVPPGRPSIVSSNSSSGAGSPPLSWGTAPAGR
jgi:hypothetical protein